MNWRERRTWLLQGEPPWFEECKGFSLQDDFFLSWAKGWKWKTLPTSIQELKLTIFLPNISFDSPTLSWLMVSLYYAYISYVVVQLLTRVRFSETPWTAAHQASLSFTISQSLLKLMSIELVMPSNYLILCFPFFSHPQPFPASGSFPMSWLFPSGG